MSKPEPSYTDWVAAMEGSQAQALILAAGRGYRLGPQYRVPKCLLDIGGASLLQRQIAALRALGVERFVVVAGYRQNLVRHELASLGLSHCQLVVNDCYRSTNSVYSLALASKYIDGPLLMLNSDVLAAEAIYRRLLSQHGNALAFDSSSGLLPEQMKVRVSGETLCAIDKELVAERSCGESLGVVKLDARSAATLLEAARGIVSAGGAHCWAPAALAEVARQVSIRALDVSGLPWVEIDFAADLDRARQQVWPHIARLQGPFTRGIKSPQALAPAIAAT